MKSLKVLTGVEIPLADGLVSGADVFVADDGERHPVLLSRTPYSRALTNLDAFNPLRAARRGYAVVIQDCRGRSGSAGQFQPFENEARDGRAAIGWCATQSWSDGRVGMWGSSYVGATQLLAATSPDSSPLVAMAPSFTAADYRDGWMLESKVFQQHFIQTWTASLGVATASASHEALGEFAKFMGDPGAFDRPLAEAFGPNASEVVPYYYEWLRRRDDEQYWGALTVAAGYQNVHAAGLHIGGWYDVFAEGVLANFSGLRANAASEVARRSQRLIMGPWEHGPIAAVVGEVNFGMAVTPMGTDIAGQHLAFFDSVFAGVEPTTPDVRLFVMGANEWQSFATWPPPSMPTTWYLDGVGPNSVRGDGQLGQARPPTGQEWRALFDPSRLVPTVGGRLVAPGMRMAGPRDQRDVEVRDDVLVFTSPPLVDAITVIGWVSALVRSASTNAPYDVCLKLTDVDELGRSVNVIDGVARIAASHRDEIQISIGSTAHRFAAGHRLRLQIAGSNHPRLEASGSHPSILTVTGGQLILPVAI